MNPIILKSLRIERIICGENKDKFEGEIAFYDNAGNRIHLILPPEFADEFLKFSMARIYNFAETLRFGLLEKINQQLQIRPPDENKP